MKELTSILAEILETQEIDLSKKFSDYDEWDSLSSLSVIALIDSDYGITITNSKILEFNSIQEFCNFILANAK